MVSEVEFQSQLTLPGPDRRIADHAEVGIANVGVRRAKYGVVEGILCLQAQFELHSFVAGGESKIFQNGQVVSEGVGAAHGSDSPRRVANGVCGRYLENIGIGEIVVDPVRFRATATLWRAEEVGPLGTVSPDGSSSTYDRKLKREAVVNGPDAGGFPAP